MWALKFGHGFWMSDGEDAGEEALAAADAHTAFRNSVGAVKPRILLQAIERAERKGYGWLFWVDADAIIADHGSTALGKEDDFLRRILHEHGVPGIELLLSLSSMSYAGGASSFNNGVWVLRASPWTREFLHAFAVDDRMRKGGIDQDVFAQMHAMNFMGLQSRTARLPPRAINSDNLYVASPPVEQPVVHLFGHPNWLRLHVFREAFQALCSGRLLPNRADPLQASYMEGLHSLVFPSTSCVEGSCDTGSALWPTRPLKRAKTLSQLLSLRGRPVEAKAALEAALASHSGGSDAQGTLGPDGAVHFGTVATLLQDLNRHIEAERWLARAFDAWPAAHHSTPVSNVDGRISALHPEAMALRLSHANLLIGLGRAGEATGHLRRLATATSATVGALHPDHLAVLDILAAALAAPPERRLAEAASVLRVVTAGRESSLGSGSSEARQARLQLARFLRDNLGDADAALAVIDAVPHVAIEALELRAEILASLGEGIRAAEAESAWRKLRSLACGALSFQPLACANACRNLGVLALRTGHLAEAEPLLREAATHAASISGDEAAGELLLASLGELTGLLMSTGRVEAARGAWQTALAASEAARGHRRSLLYCTAVAPVRVDEVRPRRSFACIS
eukprot:gnl/TRDRNA2_/TRDRNA2_127399_c0_seq2.p1 gnl/TRDRNA2_/TRDRNA2_127399_c0~~gnl/TRDRNA2_/TRDRNA2_127399_c0_seq2.p1  ORF type:complete len:666 (-),score=101.22 gnl/TRDRNA2_/TRDRNA2_127399_c0_seq2:184-2070(-)